MPPVGPTGQATDDPAGKLRAVRLGRVLRIREADYEAFLENNLV